MSGCYRDAAVCYVYLSRCFEGRLRPRPHFLDGKVGASLAGGHLQGLIAPEAVEFYPADGAYSGSLKAQAPMSNDATGIHGQALHGVHGQVNGCAFSRFSVEERLWWAEGRSTTREEDVA
jgi:hypothetical protein